ncbi:MAG: peptidase M16 domain-containing protein [Ignavibacteria bacterium]|nr:MAG: peptidase M16 domain-containing protein [Ignavibacteria bacterium]KAF0161065.1 MAG: peptidase M16 domain-containing protein [Ignavibacteria bacterium]
MKNINITLLPDGIKVISEKITHVKSFSLGFWFNVGSRDESVKNSGMSHFLEHMFFKGTKKRSAKKISEEIESLGGYLNAFTSKEHTCFYGRGLNAHIEKTFEVLADMVQNSVFAPKEIEKESKVVIDELYDIEDSPDELIFDKFESNTFAGNSLGMPIIGTEKNLRSFKQKDLLEYIEENYTLDRFMIVASGNIDHTDLVKFAKKYITRNFKSSSQKTRSVLLQPSKDVHVEKETQQVHYILGKPTYGYKDLRRISVAVLSHILGEGSSSRLFQKIREENGIAYQINTFLNSFFDISTFGVYLSTNEKSVFKAQKLIFEELEKIKHKKVTASELDRAKEYLVGNMLMSLEGTTNRMIRMAHQMIYFGKIIPVEETVNKIYKVTKEDIRDLSNELFGRRSLTDKFGEFEDCSLTRVILFPKNLLHKKA